MADKIEQTEQQKIEELATEMALNMLINGGVKVCKKCKIGKPLSEYYPEKKTADKHKNTCKDCYNELRKENADKNRTYYKNHGSLLAVADREYEEADLTLHNYKEPLTPVSDGYGYFGTIKSTNDGKYIQCHICGKLYANLGGHLYRTHKISGHSYKERFGLKFTSQLISEQERMHLKTKTIEYLKSLTEEQKEEYAKKQREVYYKYGVAKRNRHKNTKEKLEQKNEKGTCPDQILDKIREVAKSLGRTPSKRDFIVHEKSQRYVHLVYKTFGSWPKAIDAAGLKRNGNLLEVKEEYDNITLLDNLRDFVVRTGELPSKSDFKREILPPLPIYIEKFGSLQLAFSEAGLNEIMKD